MLSMFLEHVAAFDSVDDESVLERKRRRHGILLLSCCSTIRVSDLTPVLGSDVEGRYHSKPMDIYGVTPLFLAALLHTEQSEHTESVSSPLSCMGYRPPLSPYADHCRASVMWSRLRRELRMNTFAFRPHCGESGDEMHLVTSYLLGKDLSVCVPCMRELTGGGSLTVLCESADGINHGINLERTVTLMYLYYLDRIGKHGNPSL